MQEESNGKEDAAGTVDDINGVNRLVIYDLIISCSMFNPEINGVTCDHGYCMVCKLHLQ